jgi:hypothetical protein
MRISVGPIKCGRLVFSASWRHPPCRSEECGRLTISVGDIGHIVYFHRRRQQPLRYLLKNYRHGKKTSCNITTYVQNLIHLPWKEGGAPSGEQRFSSSSSYCILWVDTKQPTWRVHSRGNGPCQRKSIALVTSMGILSVLRFLIRTKELNHMLDLEWNHSNRQSESIHLM